MKFDRILILADDNKLSLKAARSGYELAQSMGASVVLAYVVDEALAMGDVDAGIFPDQALKLLKEKTAGLLQNIKKELGGDIETEILTPVGEIRNVVPQLIKSTGADLIVIETHKHSAIDRLIEGSVAERVLHCSPVPLLIIPASRKNI